MYTFFIFILFKTLCAYKHYSINCHRKYRLKHKHTSVTRQGRMALTGVNGTEYRKILETTKNS